jgi:arylformamidase
MRMFLLLAGLVAIGDDAIADMRVERDIAYAKHGDNSRRTSLDVYAPEVGDEHPVVVWIHGGAWRIGDKRAVREKPAAFVERRFVFVSINYRLYPAVDYEQQAADVARAIRWVHDHIGRFGGDPKRIFIMGHSAGAHLAALVSTDGGYLQAEKMKLGTIKGVILLDGAGYDIPRKVRWSLGKSKQLYTTVFTEEEDTQRRASPITHVARGKGIPPFLIVYVADRLGSKMQSTWLADALRKAEVEATVYPAQDKTHATVNREFGAAHDPPTKQAFAFLNDILGKDRTGSTTRPTGRLHESSVITAGLKRNFLLFIPS